MKRQLDPKDRSALRDLLLGAIEHCEISRHLIGTMVHTFYRDGIRYGIPAFTFTGPATAANLHARIGIIAGKSAGDRLSAEVTLELLERLLLQPAIAANLTLRIAPILNPAGLEKPDSGATFHALSEERIRLQSPDGLIEIVSIPGNTLHFALRANALTQQALQSASADIHRLSGELDIHLLQTLLAVDTGHRTAQADRAAACDPHTAQAEAAAGQPSHPHATDSAAGTGADWIYPSLHELRSEPWELKIGIPKDWGANVSTQVAAQFLLCFFRHLERLRAADAQAPARSSQPVPKPLPAYARNRYLHR